MSKVGLVQLVSRLQEFSYNLYSWVKAVTCHHHIKLWSCCALRLVCVSGKLTSACASYLLQTYIEVVTPISYYLKFHVVSIIMVLFVP